MASRGHADPVGGWSFALLSATAGRYASKAVRLGAGERARGGRGARSGRLGGVAPEQAACRTAETHEIAPAVAVEASRPFVGGRVMV